MSAAPGAVQGLVDTAVRRFLVTEAAVFHEGDVVANGATRPGETGGGGGPVGIAAIGTTAERAVRGELLPLAIRAAGFVPGRASAWSTPDELFSDSGWTLGVVLSPWKRDIGARCELLAQGARTTGVTDTVLRTRRGTVGFNTNSCAAQTALEVLAGGRAPARVLLVGAGASARSVAQAVGRAWPQAELVVAARRASEAAALAEQFPVRLASTLDPARLRDGGCEIVVNATTWGETDASEQEPLGVDLSGILVAGVRLFDLNNRIGSLARQALAAGCVVQAGGLMQRVTNACRAALLPFRAAGE